MALTAAAIIVAYVLVNLKKVFYCRNKFFLSYSYIDINSSIYSILDDLGKLYNW